MVAATSIANKRSIGFRATLPFWLGCVFVALICFPGLGELPGGISLALVFMLACLPIWYGAAYARQRPVLDGAGTAAAAVVLFCAGFLTIWSFASALDAEAPLRAGRYIATLAAAFAIYFLVIGTITRERLTKYLDVLCMTLALTCLVSIVAYYEPHLHTRIFQGTDRAFGFFKNPNQFGMALSTVLPVATAMALGQRRGRFVRAGCMVLLFFGLIACGSKTNLLISSMTFLFTLCAFSIVAYSGLSRIYMIGLSLVVASALLLAGLALLQLFNPRALRLMLAFFEPEGGDLPSLVSRSQIWQYSLEQFSMRPFLGQGAGQPINIFYRNESVPHSHNVLLDYLRTLGAPGFFAVLIILVTAAWMSVATIVMALAASKCEAQHRILGIGLAMGCLAYIAANMSSDSMGPSTSPFFWLILYLGLASRSLLRLPADQRRLRSEERARSTPD